MEQHDCNLNSSTKIDQICNTAVSFDNKLVFNKYSEIMSLEEENKPISYSEVVLVLISINIVWTSLAVPK